jgi:hypothetical protein
MVREHMQGPCGPLRQRQGAPSLRCAQGAAPPRSETVNTLGGVVSDFPPSTSPVRSSLRTLLGGSPRRSGSLPLAGGRRVVLTAVCAPQAAQAAATHDNAQQGPPGPIRSANSVGDTTMRPLLHHTRHAGRCPSCGLPIPRDVSAHPRPLQRSSTRNTDHTTTNNI